MHVLNILWVVFGIGLMLVLNLKFKINSMVALLVAYYSRRRPATLIVGR
ncbi:hypothetical protein, partial [Pseudomonas aeruginosa]